jgi:hypothetical protein
MDDAVYGKPWLLPGIARREGLGARGGPTLSRGFRLLRVAYPGMRAVLGMAVLVGFCWFWRGMASRGRVRIPNQDDGPGGDDPGRQFVLEVRRTSTLPDDQMKAYLLMIRPSPTPEQLSHAMRP